MKKGFKNLGFVIAFALVIALLAGVLMPQQEVEETVYSDLINEIREGKVTEIELHQTHAEITYQNGDMAVVAIPGRDWIYEGEIGQMINSQLQEGKLKISTPEPETVSWWVSMLPTVIMFGVIIAFWVFAFRQSQGGKGMGGFGKSKAKTPGENGKKVTFADVAGVEEEKKELSEIVDFLRDPMMFTSLVA